MADEARQDLFSGLIRLHVLHHACEGPVYGLWIIEELARHGYKLSAGTLYPILHALERRGLLRSEKHRNGRHVRRLYRVTPAGRRTMKDARQKVQELFGELFEHELRTVFGKSEHGHGAKRKARKGRR
jgi:DNA-binding PadR family transcriptional regulator